MWTSLCANTHVSRHLTLLQTTSLRSFHVLLLPVPARLSPSARPHPSPCEETRLPFESLRAGKRGTTAYGSPGPHIHPHPHFHPHNDLSTGEKTEDQDKRPTIVVPREGPGLQPDPTVNPHPSHREIRLAFSEHILGQIVTIR